VARALVQHHLGLLAQLFAQQAGKVLAQGGQRHQHVRIARPAAGVAQLRRMEGLDQQAATGPQARHQPAVQAGAQGRRQVDIDQHHRVEGGRRRCPIAQVGLLARPARGHAALRRQPGRLGQAHGRTVHRQHGVALLGQPDAVAALAVARQQHPARRPARRLLSQKGIGLQAILEAGLGKTLIPELTHCTNGCW
jgi:hypothetical protein